MTRKVDPSRWERLRSEERRALLDFIGVEPGSVAADLGAGSAFFTGSLAARVGPGGDRLRGGHLAGQGTPASGPGPAGRGSGPAERRRPPSIPDQAVDLTLLAFVLHELDEPARFLAETRRALKSSGRLVVLEWVPREEPMGPPVHERLSEEVSRRILTSSGFRGDAGRMANRSNHFLIAHPERAC